MWKLLNLKGQHIQIIKNISLYQNILLNQLNHYKWNQQPEHLLFPNEYKHIVPSSIADRFKKYTIYKSSADFQIVHPLYNIIFRLPVSDL